MLPYEILAVRTAPQLTILAQLAHDIWYEYYVPIIGRAQVDYMVAKFQSVAAMRQQLQEDYEYFALVRQGEWIGYCALQPQPIENCLFISKLYVRSGHRGQGTGRCALAFINKRACDLDLGLLALTVNKRNPALNTYQRWGFRIDRSLVIDIGGGFVMDDFRMEKTVDELRMPTPTPDT